MPNPPSSYEIDSDADVYGDATPAPLPQAKLSDAQRLACLQLIRSANVGPVTFRDLVNHFGGAQAALDALPEIYARGGGPQAQKSGIRNGRNSRGRIINICPRDQAEAELAAAARIGSRPLFTIEPGYPAALAQIEAPPPMIYARGNIDLLVSRPAIAIVGSRSSSAAGITLARQFASELGQSGYVIASGLARGIDGAAHKAALETGTVAVVAGGLDVVYPPEHEDLHRDIGERGCLVSEMPPGFKPRGKDFPRRNRIISGLSLGVIVVEAARRSGTLITARMAGEQGREVFAVPGHPLDPRAEGTNQLLKMGATMVTASSDVIETLSPMLGGMNGHGGRVQLLEAAIPMEAPTSEANKPAPPQIEDSDRSRVTQALGPAPINIDEVARAVALPIRAVQIVIMELDLAGRIERHGHQLISLRPLTVD